MRCTVNQARRSVSFKISKRLYSNDGLRIAAHVFSSRAEVLCGQDEARYVVTLRAKRRDADRGALEALAGEYLNELLNQEYRFLVGRFNQRIASLIVTQALVAARGGEKPRPAPAEERAPEFQAQVQALLKEAAEEIRRTMPKRIPPQGAPLPPAAEEACG